MFSKNSDTPADNLDKEINDLLLAMKAMKKSDAEYPQMVDLLTKLYGLKNDSVPQGLSLETKATLATNIAGLLLVLNYEKLGVITSKAFGLVQKIR